VSKLAEHIPPYSPALRRAKDRLATATITAGGAAVLLAILLIFFYLLYEVLPLFGSAGISQRSTFQWSAEHGTPIYLAVEEQGELGFALDAQGDAHFFETDGGTVRKSVTAGNGGTVTAVVAQSADSSLVALGYHDGRVTLLQHEYKLSYPGGNRLISPHVETPYTNQNFHLTDGAISKLAVSDSEDALIIVAESTQGQINLQRYRKEVDFLTEEVVLEREDLVLPLLSGKTAALYIGSSQRWLYRLNTTGQYSVLDLKRINEDGTLRLVALGSAFSGPGRLTSSEMLLGGISLLAASDQGELVQLFMVRDERGERLERIRAFDTEGVVTVRLLPEHRRKGVLGIGADGELLILHSTAHRTLLNEPVFSGTAVSQAAISPRGSRLLMINSEGHVEYWNIDNEHPDISWSALWEKVWYESYEEPSYTWQSSASNNDFEPKYSFSPLAFGTLKAAFYTMLIAAPLGICGAIYTAYFMAASLRRKVKPLIELMEALPTVILGFLAGLWLAPFVENYLTGVFAVLLVVPLGTLAFAFGWSRLPVSWQSRVPEGWHAALLVPVVALLGYLSFAGNDILELWLFGGDMRVWITSELGISFDQRNALIVGIAMGMAVIPTIFSITEDAIFAVPKHLSYGSLALGATPWQTLVGVVLPTASPGIFSALMIGMGRAVGETMIVLMATGNTPIMDANIFEGMRTLAANIAVEVPEAEVDSTHYRVLFLAALVLFMFTFVVNTIAELVRQRLRLKYGSL